jgi:hypothetical protein
LQLEDPLLGTPLGAVERFKGRSELRFGIADRYPDPLRTNIETDNFAHGCARFKGGVLLSRAGLDPTVLLTYRKVAYCKDVLNELIEDELAFSLR